MNNQTTPQNPLNTEVIEQGANVAFLLGVIAIVQGAFVAGFWLGVALLVLGVLGILGSAVRLRVPWQRIVERLAILGMMIGIVGMFQSWQINLYENGFYILGISTLIFIIISHVPTPKSE